MTRTRNGKQLGRHLTAKNVYTLPGPAGDSPNVDYMDPSLPGFGLRVSRGGQRTWIVRYTVSTTGRRRRMGLGECRSDEKGVTLAAARDKARRALRQAEDGIDPLGEKQEQREAKTFEQLAHDWVTYHAKDKRSLPEDQRILDNELLPDWKDVPVKDIRRDMVLAKVRAKATTAPVMANRIGSLINSMLNQALADQLVEANVAARLKKEPEESRERVLTDAEIAELWPVLSETTHTDAEGRPVARLNEAMNDALKFDFLTASRSGAEAAQARWTDIDIIGEVWEIPGEFTKNGRPHRVPLTAPAMEIIARRLATARPTATWVFEHTAGTHVGARLKKACAFLCKGDAHLSRRRKDAKGPAKRKQRPPFQPGVSFTFWRHDLRRTAATWLGEAGVLDETISRVLNHKTDGPRSTPTYNRAKYDAVKRAALEVVARRLETVISGRNPAANVLPFAGTR